MDVGALKAVIQKYDFMAIVAVALPDRVFNGAPAVLSHIDVLMGKEEAASI
jgi:hypothetical protein